MFWCCLLDQAAVLKKKIAVSKSTAVANFEYEKLPVEELDSIKKFHEFLKLSDFYHIEQCENEDCPNYLL